MQRAPEGGDFREVWARGSAPVHGRAKVERGPGVLAFPLLQKPADLTEIMNVYGSVQGSNFPLDPDGLSPS